MRVSILVTNEDDAYRDVRVSIVVNESTGEEYKTYVSMDKQAHRVYRSGEWSHSPSAADWFDECGDVPATVIETFEAHVGKAEALAAGAVSANSAEPQ